MLVLTVSEVNGKSKILIGDNIIISVLKVDKSSGQVRLGIIAPGKQVDRESVRLSKDRQAAREEFQALQEAEQEKGEVNFNK